jgi:hypothetical protein
VSLIVVFGFVCVGASLALWLKYRSAPPSDARVAADVGAALGLTPADLKTLGQLAGGAGVGAGRVVGLMLSPSALARAVEERLAESHARKEVALMKALLDRLG